MPRPLVNTAPPQRSRVAAMPDARPDAGPPAARRTAWRRRSLALVDQGLSSLSNVLAVALVAHVLDPDAFGRFSLSYAVLVAVLGLSRSWFGTRVSLVAEPAEVRPAASVALGGLLILTPAIAGVVLGLGWVLTGGQPGLLGVVVALAAPVVCMQDALRFAAVACGRPAVAFASDLVWLAGLLALIPLLRSASSSVVMILWLASAAVALVVAIVGLGVRPSLADGLADLRTRHRTGESISFGTVVTTGASLVVVGVAGAALGPAAVGSLRGASTVMGPLNVVFAYVNLALTPILVRRSRRLDLKFCRATGAGVLVSVAFWSLLVLVIPESWGHALLGQTWSGTRSVLPFTAAEYAGIGLATASTLGLKVRHEAGMLMQQKAIVALVTIALGCSAALLFDQVRAVSAGLAVAAAVSVALGWRHLIHSVNTRVPQPAASGAP